MQGDTIITYRLDLGDGEIVEFDIDTERGLTDGNGCETPEWTKLSFFRCEHCREKDDAETCRLALSLVRVVDRFQAIISHDRIGLEVITPERRICQETTAQRAMSSLMGLLIATSGCPHTDFLRPMARFHLPLASEQETVYRAVSCYMLAQYFRHQERLEVDMEFAGLNRLYQNLQIVNMSVVKRLRKASQTDSSVNALILLDLYAKAMPFSLADSLEEFQHLFSAYLKD